MIRIVRAEAASVKAGQLLLVGLKKGATMYCTIQLWQSYCATPAPDSPVPSAGKGRYYRPLQGRAAHRPPPVSLIPDVFPPCILAPCLLASFQSPPYPQPLTEGRARREPSCDPRAGGRDEWMDVWLTPTWCTHVIIAVTNGKAIATKFSSGTLFPPVWWQEREVISEGKR